MVLMTRQKNATDFLLLSKNCEQDKDKKIETSIIHTGLKVFVPFLSCLSWLLVVLVYAYYRGMDDQPSLLFRTFSTLKAQGAILVAMSLVLFLAPRCNGYAGCHHQR